MRRTIARPAELAGVGLHTGARVHLRLLPADDGQGIVFVRSDQPAASRIPAVLSAVSATERRTVLGPPGCSVATVEHLLAAVVAAGVEDLLIEVDGEELPIVDGSFAPFLALLHEAGIEARSMPSQRLVLDRGFEVEDGESHYQVEPADGLHLDIGLEYAEPVIGRQRAKLTVSAAGFAQECAAARTFGFEGELAALRARGLIRGATPDSGILCSATAVLNTTLRWPDEFARHKLGDLLGDLALLGVRPRVRIVAERPSHRGNLTCMRALARAGRIEEDR